MFNRGPTLRLTTDPAAAELLLLAAAAFVGSAAQSATGFGIALAISPAAFAVASPAEAVMLVAICGMLNNLLVLAAGRLEHFRRTEAQMLLAGAAPGLIAGTFVVAILPKAPLQVTVGVVVLAALVLQRMRPPRTEPSTPTAIPVGTVAGLLTTTVGISGPPLVLWLRARAVRLDELRDTLAVVFLVLNLAAIPTLAVHGEFPGLAEGAVCVAGLAAGHLAGTATARRISEEALVAGLTALLVAAGLSSVAAGLL